jgi:hypothetical protein
MQKIGQKQSITGAALSGGTHYPIPIIKNILFEGWFHPYLDVLTRGKLVS